MTQVGIPAVLPATTAGLPEPLSFFTLFWLPDDYFKPPYEAANNSRIDFFESWQHRTLAGGFLKHTDSKTLLGGAFGTVWGVRAILKVLFNIGAVTGKLKPPTPQPAHLDSGRVSENDWNHCLGYLAVWNKTILTSIEVLKLTFDERSRLPRSIDMAPGQLDFEDQRNDPLTDPATVDAGPSRGLRKRPVPRLPPTLDAAADDDSTRSFTDSEASNSDNFKPDGVDSDVEDEGEDADTAKKSSRGREKKGKNVAAGEKNPKQATLAEDESVAPDDFNSRVLKAGMNSSRTGYEIARGE